MFTRKHYRAIAGLVKQHHNKAYQFIVTKPFVAALADYFEADNPKFDREKFYRACGIS